jgi:hypothetical protein
MEKQQDIGTVVLSPVIEKYTIARPLAGEEAREVYNEVRGRAEKDFKNSPVFNTHFSFNEDKGVITGSNTYWGILVNNALNERGFRLPTITEARELDSEGKLSNNVYRDFGMAVYNDGTPNQEVAKKLVEEAEKRGWELPVLAPFEALRLLKTGTRISFGKDPKGIISGDEARQYLSDNFTYKGNSGARRLIRNRNGYWNAGWSGLDDSVDYGRVDWLCGEATRADLETAVLKDVSKVAKAEIDSLNARIESAKQAAIKTLKG